MSIEEIIRHWKADVDDQAIGFVANPVGEELTDKELQEISGSVCANGFTCTSTFTCANVLTCANGITFCIVAPTA